ncbi:hypothetical protein PV325_000782 [Microctonus aethiopoides]|uniref:Uncharacterized protein n=1 Tax=Microctonus aethiopoides TaxID=144406 RepID=A0AA39F6W6_9HYME|nr:hypothetical protein PV325_000782 [Microctonus aethiopoides]KAK0095591.1 hypothetical protein PV326_007884 [Microctonus aethiopoides]KAK0163966.1 hypothetical protein PV328_002645 [Microctonus aethiopoides]
MQENNHLKQLQDYRQELENEKESLKKIQKIIQKQINALDIERLHLESVAKGPATKSTTITDIDKTHENDDDDELNPLDLNVPNMIEDNEEEEEDDENL